MSPVMLLAIGYGRWPASSRTAKLLAALKSAGVGLLVDIRHSPCASNLDADHHYGPRDWHVQAGGKGIASVLQTAGIGYLWLVELGNPQKQDDEMTVLREHLGDPKVDWPVHRGLDRLEQLVRTDGQRCCVMCACASYEECHRQLIAESLAARFAPGELEIRDLSR
jgi:uncharacterized protein (DUF488 family)